MLRATSPQAVADSTTPVETVPTASAVSLTRAAICLAMTLCSSTAEAIVAEVWLTWRIASPTSPIERTASPVEPWMCWIRLRMSSVAPAVWRASSLTSVATTAKPLPASPARAASIVALRAKQVGLLGDVLDHLDHLADFLGGGAELADRLVAVLGQRRGGVGDAGGLFGRLGDLADAARSAR